MLHFKKIKTRTILYLLPSTILVLALSAFISYNQSKNLLTDQINEKMQNKLQETVNLLDGRLQEHSRVVESLSRTVETAGTSLTREQYKDILMKDAIVDKDTYGIGVWFEPYKYNNIKLFGPYAYKGDNNDAVYTEDYMTEDYNFPNQDYYKQAKTGTREGVWGEPYYDDSSKMTFLTESIPLYDSNNNFMGCITGDLNLSYLQQVVDSIRVGSMGKAFLITDKGTYLAGVDKNKVLKNSITKDSNSSLATLGQTILKKKNGDGYYNENGKVLAYYATVPNTNWRLVITMPQSELYKPVNTLLYVLLFLIAVSAIILVIIILLYSSYITKHIGKVNTFSSVIASGDLSGSITVDSYDELGQMSGSLNKMAKVLKDLIQNVSNNLEQVVSTSEELTASAEQTESAAEQVAITAQDIAQNSENQSRITEETSDKIIQISKNINNITDNFSAAADASVQASGLAADGNKVVLKAKDQMNLISSKVLESSSVINILGKKSSEIDEIVSIITDISAQTNLLALNAAIEAARAGEQGKGFAVVADEVKKLAEQSADAAGKISSLIGDIQSEISNAVNNMSQETAAVQEGIYMVDNAGKSFEEISASVDTLSGQVSSIAIMIENIHKDSESMVKHIQEISKISKETSASIQGSAAASEEQNALMKEVSNAAASLTDMAMELQNSISKFKL